MSQQHPAIPDGRHDIHHEIHINSTPKDTSSLPLDSARLLEDMGAWADEAAAMPGSEQGGWGGILKTYGASVGTG